MRSWSAALLALLALAACHKKAEPDPRADVIAQANDAVHAQALKDLQSDLILVRAQLAMIAQPPPPGHARDHAAVAQTALYTCERLAIASKQIGRASCRE